MKIALITLLILLAVLAATIVIGSLIRFGTELDDEQEWWR